jgi:histone acetyltransferase (RNA polymerase elongator complex component)
MRPEKALKNYSPMLDQISNHRPFIIPIFLPHAGCPHQCVFCNQTAITGVKQSIVSSETVDLLIDVFLEYKRPHRRPAQVAFYGGNFLGLKKDAIRRLLGHTMKSVIDGRIDSIRFSTRPETIDREHLEIISDYPVSTVEIGAQSMDDRVLAMAKRGHTAADTVTAVMLLKERGYTIGLQTMVGLPGDDETGSFYTAQRIAELVPDFVRIYPTIVLENSRLGRWYSQGKYTPWSLERCVAHVKDLYLYYKKKVIPVIRMGLQASEDLEKGATLLSGPYHPAFGHMVHSEIFMDMAAEVMEKRSAFEDTVAIKVHPRSISKMRGLKNKNVDALQKRFHIKSLKIVPDSSLAQDRLTVST